MTYIQLVSPNLITVGQIGWCLSFVEDVFKTPHSYATATDAWNATRSPHRDRNLPPDVSVPVWYSYYEGGLNFGHVAVNVPGKGVLSSPYKANNSQQWFKDIDECGRVLNSTYLGWSEDLAGIQLIKKGDTMNSEAKKGIYRSCVHREPENDQVWRGISDDPEKALNDVRQSKEWLGQNHILLKAYPDAVKQIADLQKQIDSMGKPTELKPGIYKAN